MKVSTERLPDSQLKVDIEVEPERVERSIEAAYRRLAPRVKIPGFRPGKAPRPMVERQLGGRDALLHEALDRLLPEVYDEVVDEQSIDAIDLPKLSITSIEPVAFTATVPVRPSVQLGDYRSLRVEHEPVEIPEEQVDATLERLQRTQATVEPAERPVQLGDVVRANVTAVIDGEEQFTQDDAEFPIREGVEVSLPGFTGNLVGMGRGEKREFGVPFPDDYQDEPLRGKRIDYTVTINEIKEERLPTLDNEFAQGVGKGYESVEVLKDEIRADIRAELERQERSRYETRALDELVPLAELEYPSILVERELEHLMTDHKGGRSPDVSNQIERLGKSEDEIKADLRPQAEERVRKSLILGELTQAENLDVNEDEVEAELSRLSEGAGEAAEQLRELFANDSGRATIRRSLLTRKTFERLVEIAEGTASESVPVATKPRPATPSETRKARKPRTSKSPTSDQTEIEQETSAAKETETA